jgi:short-subunit dehydrogenase
MTLNLKPIAEQVIVITGASSGIGLATAELAARKGARVVLAARSEDALAENCRRINSKGGKSMHVVADVGNREDVRRIAERTISEFGGFDTWVNNAGVGLFGRLEELSDADQRRLFDTNFWGVVYGSVIGVEHLKNRGGALINLGSEVSDVPVPIQGMYAASKHAVKGFTDSLRIELLEEDAPVSITLIRPAAIDTPFTKHARNYLDREPKLPPPVYHPHEVAASIVHAATHPEREVFVGGASRLMSGVARHWPETSDWIGATILSKSQLRDEPAQTRHGALHQPAREGYYGTTRGDHPGYVRKVSFYSRATRNPMLAGLVALGVGVAAAKLVSSVTSESRSRKNLPTHESVR